MKKSICIIYRLPLFLYTSLFRHLRWQGNGFSAECKNRSYLCTSPWQRSQLISRAFISRMTGKQRWRQIHTLINTASKG
ncbi:hypothetical protein SRHO_G00266050 [Serrasalmus rhombeus]